MSIGERREKRFAVKPITPVSIAALGATIVLAFVLMTAEASTSAGASSTGGMDAMSIDMDPSGTTANTATSIGSREFCARINENDLLDADEDDIDTLEIDVTTGPQGIPESNPMIAYSFRLNYLSSYLTIVGVDPLLLIAAAPGSQAFNPGSPTPDNTGVYIVDATDLNVDASATESGPGVLARLSIEAESGISDGLYDLIIDSAAHINDENQIAEPLEINHGLLAVGVDCPASQPPPAPAPKPANDDFENAIAIDSLPFRDIREGYFGSTESATTEEGEPTPCGGIGRTLWYSLALTDDAPIRIEFSSFGMVIAVYRGTSLGTLTPVFCDYTGETRQFSAEAGETYFIQWGGFDGASIVGSLRIVDTDATPTPSPPPVTPVPDGGMDAMSIDMDPGASPANTATSIGSREFCARINENDLLDADEDAVDKLEIDVTTGPDGIPEATGILGFQVEILYQAGIVRIVGEDLDFLLFSNVGSAQSSNLGDTLPDFDGRFVSAAFDSNTNKPGTDPESGPGVLTRLMIESEPGAASGVYHLVLDESQSAHVDFRGQGYGPKELNHAIVAIGEECPSAQPQPSLPPTPTPPPVSTPRESPLMDTPPPLAPPTSVPTGTPTPPPPVLTVESALPGGGIGGDGPAALPNTGGTPPAGGDDGPIAGLTIAGLGIVAAAAWVTARAVKR